MSNSFINPLLIRGIFKGFVFRAKKLRSKKNLEEELNFLDVYVENVCNRSYLNSIVRK